MDIVLLAFFASFGVVFTLWKIFGMKALKYDWFFDILLTVGLPICFYGTYKGMMLAVFTGIFVSIELFILKKLLYVKPTKKGKKK